MKRFVSIDVDYWAFGKYNADGPAPFWPSVPLERYLNQVTELARQKGIPISCVMNHNQMLEKVCKSNADQLFNIDSHSDLCSKDVEVLNCGTWISYVSWRKQGEYVWFTPQHCKSSGDCCGYGAIFGDDYMRPSLSDWKSIKQELSAILPSPEELLADAVEVCVCMSPAYSEPEQIQIFNRWRKNHQVPYTKGVLDEDIWEIDGRKPSYYEQRFGRAS